MKKKAIFNWSGGKDSAHALWRAIQSNEYDIVALLTTVNRDTSRSTMHGIPMELLEAQSESIGIPLRVVELKSGGNMEDYQSAMDKAVGGLKREGITHSIFGDIFLYDVRGYREQQLKPLGIELVEPLWGKPSREVIEDFLKTGLKTTVVTTMADGLGMNAIGRTIDRKFIDELPEGCDPNGENGEYHTFCYDGPIFSKPVPFRLGKAFEESHDIRMEDGEVKTFTYCFANLNAVKK